MPTHIETAYNTQGQIDTITTYNAASSGAVVNQIKRDYNGFGQMTKEWQQHGNTVNTSTSGTTSLAVSYAYTDDSDPSNVSKYGSRLMAMTYPNGKVLTYSYGTANSLNDLIGRLDALTESSGSVIVESYKYLGLSTVVERDHPQVTGTLALTYIAQGTGDHASDSGADDPYVGLDRFGRVVDQRWTTTGGSTDKDRYQYTYDPDGNVLTKTNTLHTAFNEDYTYHSTHAAPVKWFSSLTEDAWTVDVHLAKHPPFYLDDGVDPTRGTLSMPDTPGDNSAPRNLAEQSFRFETVVVASRGCYELA